MNDIAVFSLFVRRLPDRRNYLLACGIEDVLAFLETVRFDEPAPARTWTRSAALPISF
jgi:nicotinate phosphoribosyltransferase